MTSNQTTAQLAKKYVESAIALLAHSQPDVAQTIVRELEDQRSNLKLIASENYSSIVSQSAMGNWLTDKYAEGFPMHRFYAGCDNVDLIEAEGCKVACELFGAEAAYMQAHSGADANLIAFWAILQTRAEGEFLKERDKENINVLDASEWELLRAHNHKQKLLALDYYSGGHLTHGYRHNLSAQMFDAYSYSVSKETGLLDYEEIEKQAMEIRPLILLAGYSAYPRKINFERMAQIAKKVGAVFMVDMAHFAGLVAGKVFEGPYNPIPYADVVTSTTHKTLRGPRGGLILCKQEFAEAVNKGCPRVIGGPLSHVMAAKVVAFREALKPEFAQYAAKIVTNAHALAQELSDLGIKVASGGTDNHIVLVNVQDSFGISGRQAEGALRECGITCNRNSLPFDPNGAWYTSGVRLGTPAITTLGMGEAQMQLIAKEIKNILSATKPTQTSKGPSKAKYTLDEAVKATATQNLRQLLDQYPVYPELDLAELKSIAGL
jgi:glycine hydroxymethyltransferase